MMRTLPLRRLILPTLFLIALTSTVVAKPLTDPEIAEKLHITVQELHGLRAEFQLDNYQVLALTRIQLEGMVEGLSRAHADHHAEEAAFRAKKLKDENGDIPVDGLAKALKHHQTHHGRPEHDSGEEEDLVPGLPDPSTNS